MSIACVSRLTPSSIRKGRDEEAEEGREDGRGAHEREIPRLPEIWNSFIKRKIGSAVVGMQYFDGFIWWKHFFVVKKIQSNPKVRETSG